MGWGIVSYIIRYYFNPCGTGSHLYPANTNTLRSRTLSSRSYSTLVGLAFSFSLASLIAPLLYHNLGDLSRGFYIFLEPQSPASTQWGRLTSPVCSSSWHPYCITTWAVCQGVFSLVSDGTWPPRLGRQPSTSPLDNDSITHNEWFVKHFGRIIFFIFFAFSSWQIAEGVV